jgi:hypothetical protein
VPSPACGFNRIPDLLGCEDGKIHLRNGYQSAPMLNEPHGCGRRRNLEVPFHLGQDDPATGAQPETLADFLGNDDPPAGIDGC